MKILGLKKNRIVPRHIDLEGYAYARSKDLSFPELLLVIETRLNNLSKRYYELGLFFELKIIEGNGRDCFQVTLSSRYPDALDIVRDDVEQILWSYNKQLLVLEKGEFRPRYCRYNYVIQFNCEKFAMIKGGIA